MAQHEKDPAARSPGASDAPGVERRTTADAVHATPERPDDEAIFAPIEPEPTVAEYEHEHERAHAEEQTIAPETPEGAVEPAPVPRKKNRQPVTLLVATLGLLATAGAIGAYRFRDKNEKLASFANAVDDLAQPEKIAGLILENGAKWLGRAGKPGKKAPDATAPQPSSVAQPAPVATEKRAPSGAIAEKDSEPTPKARGSEERVTWTSPSPAPAPAPVAPVNEAAPAPRSEDMEALTKRVDRLEETARSALKAAEDARSEAASAPAQTSDTQAQEPLQALSALETRVDELAAEVRALKEKLDAPKGETRLPREQVEGAKTANPAVIVVVAHSLQKALERGAPFASEYAALAAQGADPDALSALAPTAENGAPTAHRLLADFRPLARQIEAASAPKADAPIGDKLLHGVSKLVKVRPANEKPASTVPENVAKIEAALGRDDLAGALQAFDELPETAKSVAQAWGEAAKQRLDAEKAVASILASAVAALGKSKS